MNTVINLIKNPKYWIIFTIIITSVVALLWLQYEHSQKIVKLQKIERKIERLQQENTRINQELVNTQSDEKLPPIATQLENVPLYFESFGLEFTRDKIDVNGVYYNAIVSGSLLNLLISLQEIDTQKIPLIYKNIAVKDSIAALHIIILGSK